MAKKRMVYHSELMHFNALPGKHPYENYQMQDFINALSRNRFLFAWDVGLGKSWALTALLEHLRFYNIINKCVLFTSGIGVWNLKSVASFPMPFIILTSHRTYTALIQFKIFLRSRTVRNISFGFRKTRTFSFIGNQ